MDASRAFRLDDRVIAVTGASSGIGEQLALGCAAAGARVALLARRADRLQALAARIRDAGGTALPLPLDLTDAAACAAAFETLARELGPVHGLVNNAGVGKPKTFLKSAESDLQDTLAINLVAPWRLAQLAARQMIAAGHGGAIVNIASVLGLGVAAGYSSYSVSKAALLQMTQSLGAELLRHSIRVNAIAPGWFRTEMNDAFFATEAGKAYLERLPTGRLGRLEELMGPTLLLLSDAGSGINGAVLSVDLGHHALLA